MAQKIPHDPDELIAIIDENDTIIGKATRRQAHEKQLLHREAAVLVINDRKEVLLQKRKDNGLWDCSASGHMPYQDSYLQGARRELLEELGIMAGEGELVEFGYYKKIESVGNFRHLKAYIYRTKKNIHEFYIDSQEVDMIRYFSKDDMEKLQKSAKKSLTNAASKILIDLIDKGIIN